MRVRRIARPSRLPLEEVADLAPTDRLDAVVGRRAGHVGLGTRARRDETLRLPLENFLTRTSAQSVRDDRARAGWDPPAQGRPPEARHGPKIEESARGQVSGKTDPPGGTDARGSPDRRRESEDRGLPAVACVSRAESDVAYAGAVGPRRPKTSPGRPASRCRKASTLGRPEWSETPCADHEPRWRTYQYKRRTEGEVQALSSPLGGG